MPDSLHVDIFCEDRGHESFVRRVVLKVAEDQGLDVELRTPSARGGKGKALEEFLAYQRAVRQGISDRPAPDLLIVVIDCNCSDWHAVRDEIRNQIDDAVFPRSVVACPDPHVESWYLADPPSFTQVIGHDPTPVPEGCDREAYKRELSNALRAGNKQVLSGSSEFAPEIVEAMDLYDAGRRQASLGHFVDALSTKLTAADRAQP